MRPAAGLLIALAVVAGGCSNEERVPSMDEYLTLVTDLGSYDNEVRRKAIRTILSRPQQPTKAALRAILRGDVPGHWNQRERVTIAMILATWEDEETGEVDATGLPELIEALRGPDASLRNMATEALPLLGRKAVPLVKDVLRTGQKENRIAAAKVLGLMLERNQEEAAGLALLGTSLKDEPDSEVRMAVVINLAQWKSPKAIDGFIDALTDPVDGIRFFAWQEIKRRCKPPVAFNPQDEMAARAEAIQKLRAWWRQEKKRRGLAVNDRPRGR